MFGKKEVKKKSSASGGSSSYHETSTVQHSNNDSTVTKKTTLSTFRSFSSNENTFSISHSQSAGNVPSLQTDAVPFNRNLSLSSTPAMISNRFSTSITNRTSLDPWNANLNSSTYTSPYFTNSARTHFGSYPSRLRPQGTTVSETPLQTQSIFQRTTPRTDTIIPTYSIKCDKLGKALVINNIKFLKKEEERLGAKKDSEDMEKVLKKIGFEVEHKTNLKAKEMFKKIKDFSSGNFTRYDISLVVIMSHGNNLSVEANKLASIKGGFTQIVGVDNVPLLTEDVVEQFIGTNCHKTLNGKPKIFIFQCCRGDKDQEVCHDAAPIKPQQKQYADVLIAYSTLPGYLSNRNPKTGSWYIQRLCKVFEEHYKSYSVEELLKIVDDQLSKIHPTYTQTSTYESRGFKRCYLFKDSS